MINSNKNAGIYCIRCLVNDKMYIGQSRSLISRFGQHKRHLRKKSHYSKGLQQDFNKYGIDSFEFIVLEICDLFRLNERERYWINYFRPVYNSLSGSVSVNKRKPEIGIILSVFFEIYVKTIKPEDRDKIRPKWHFRTK